MTAWRRLIIVATLLAMSPGVLRAESGQQPESSPIPSSVWDSAPEPEDKKPASDESTADTARAEVSDPCLEGPVLEVSLKGCDVPGCKDPAFVAGLLDLADLTTGVVADAGRRSTGLERLGRLGFFRSASIVCEPAVGGVFATLVVVVERRLRSLVFKGNSHFDDSAIANRLALQRGDRIDALDSGTTELLERSRDAIRRAYQEEGFIGTVVTTRLQDVGNTLTDMMVDIKEGSRVRIRDVHVGLGPSRPDDPGASSTAEGCPVVLERDLKNWAGLESASTLTEKTIPNVISRLTRALRVVGFSGVRVEAAFDASSQGLRIEAKYDSCYLLRFYSRDRELPGRVGFTPLKDEDLLKSLPFADSGVFDLAESVLGREEVRGWFENRGFLFAGVVLDYRQRRGTSDSVAQDEIVHAGGGAWGRHVAGRVSYFITRGGKVEIRDIRLSGVKSLPIEKVRGVMATKEYDFLGGPGAVLPDQVFSDMEQIRRMYAENGFRNMRFLGTVDSGQRVRQKTEEGTSTVYTYATDSQAFQVVVLPGNTEGVLLRIGIDEGTRTLVGKVAIDGVVSKRLDEAIKVLDLGSSGPFSPSRVRAAVQRLARWYAASGHLRTSIVVLCGGDDPEAPCDLDNVTAEKVELTVRVNEGTPATIGSVFVQGLGRTKPVTVTSRLPKPGDPYDVVRVADGVRYLNDLGIFTSVQVSAVGADENPPRNQVALVVECRETKTRFIDFALGFETMNDARANVMPESAISGISTSIGLSDLVTSGSGRSVDLPLPDILLTIEARYVDLNFLGLGKRMYLPIKYGLSFTAWDRYASFAPTYHDPNFFVRGLSFRATPYAVYDRATKAIDQIQFGAEFVVSRELYKRLHGALAWETGVVKTRDALVAGATYSNWIYENKLVPTLTYDRLDHPVNPKNGGFVQVSFSYINALSEGNFIKYELLAKGFLTIRNFLTFGLTAHYGGSEAFGGGGRLPLEERYSLGGNRGVRGFSNDSIGQYDKQGRMRVEAKLVDGVVQYQKVYGGDTVVSGSLEMRFPILRSLDLHGALFYDFGALAEAPTDLNPRSIRQSVGLGLRYLLGGVVPIRLDYGIILDRRCKSVNQKDGKCWVREEFGNIHFGVLYTF